MWQVITIDLATVKGVQWGSGLYTTVGDLQFLPRNTSGSNKMFGDGALSISSIMFTASGTPLSVDEVISKAATSISLYPNPAQDKVTISAQNSIEKVEVFSMLGKIVLTSTLSTLDISNLAAGMYIAKVYQEGGGVSTKRFVKK